MEMNRMHITLHLTRVKTHVLIPTRPTDPTKNLFITLSVFLPCFWVMLINIRLTYTIWN